MDKGWVYKWMVRTGESANNVGGGRGRVDRKIILQRTI